MLISVVYSIGLSTLNIGETNMEFYCQLATTPRRIVSELITKSIAKGRLHHGLVVVKINKKSVILTHIAFMEYRIKVKKEFIGTLIA